MNAASKNGTSALWQVCCYVLSTLSFLPDVVAAEDAAEVLEEILVYGRAEQQVGTLSSASAGMAGYDDIARVPLLRVGELTEVIPGMVATQHSGSGKANQYFLRGFNLDHGTDFAAFADGVPLNMRTHGHGQGYLDLNFLIPELVATTSYRKGPYSAEVGDFSSAGSVQFEFFDSLDETVVSTTIGSYGFYRAVVAGGMDAASGVLTTAVDLSAYDGPWDLDENLKQTKFYASYGKELGGAYGKLTLQVYDGDWNSSDQIPLRAVNSGLVSAQGFIDPDLGGQTERVSLSGVLDFDNWQVSAYVIDYDFSLFSNFTYFLNDPVFGDQFEQRDDRTVFGANVAGERQLTSAGRPLTVRWGTDLRFDDIHEVGLYKTAQRIRSGAVRQDQVNELSVSAFGDLELSLTERLRTSVGLRADFYQWDVVALRAENSGRGSDELLSPKFNLAYRFHDSLEGYLNWGSGFHSNDVRGTTITIDPVSQIPAESVDALVRSVGAEAGLRFERSRRFNATLVAFRLALDSELVFVGDAGTTALSGATERTGVEAAAFWQANDWLAVNAAYTATDAKFKREQAGGRKIPGAVDQTFTLGLFGAWQNGLNVSARVRFLGDAALVEDDSVRSDSSFLINAGIAYRRRSTELRLDVFNLLNSDDNDISYFYTSRLRDEPGEGLNDVHFHPLEPRAIRASITLFGN